ncbi:4Fe-4S dicluster domain-containing protein [Aeromonas salmonicida]|uniref:4Fe-4S dicluster domain-containing protein n=1 Tax=Aeromonas salmonicida TaxID=645 RepID=UPI003D001025
MRARTSSGHHRREGPGPTIPICDRLPTQTSCDIKDTQFQNIIWTPPQGGSGPNYPNM